MPGDSPLFYALTALTLTVFAAGLLARLVVWNGTRPLGRGRSGVDDVARALRMSGGALRGWLRSRPMWAAFIANLIIQPRLFRTGRTRWLIHQAIFWSFLELFLLGSLGLFVAKTTGVPLEKNDAWFALTNEVSGLLLVIAILAALTLPHLPVSAPGASARYRLILLLLGAMALSGFVVEASRIAADAVPTATARYSFLSYGLERLTGDVGVSLSSAESVVWWSHAAVGLILVAFWPATRLFHAFTGPLTLALGSRGGEPAPARPWEAASGPASAGLLALDACTLCGECTRWCEAYVGAIATSDGDGADMTAPMQRLRRFRSLIRVDASDVLWRGRPQPSETDWEHFSAGLYRCTMCARCVQACPVGIDLLDVWQGMREEVTRRGAEPAAFALPRSALVESRNVLDYPNIERGSWADYMTNAPADGFQREHAEVLYYVGCMTSFSPAAQSIAEAFAETLMAAQVDFAILGEDEWCCGFPLETAGMGAEAEALRAHNLEAVRQLGATTVVFNCPSCYRTWSRHYAPQLPGVKMYHASQYIERLIGEGRLTLGELSLSVTYHDPCDLGRNMGVYESPRRVLLCVPGLELLEANPNREKAHCCGGGGDLEIADADLTARIGDRTGASLERMGAEAIVTACPQCLRQFKSSASRRQSDTEVVDLCEIIARSLAEAGRAPSEESRAAGPAAAQAIAAAGEGK